MSWALQHLGDKKVSTLRRKSLSAAWKVATSPSSRKPRMPSSIGFSDENLTLHADFSTERREHPGVKPAFSPAEQGLLLGKKATCRQTGR
jgi:hypothetical protein